MIGGSTGNINTANYGKGGPQWSPPTIGGSTANGIMAFPDGMVPQWSPPTIGGSTSPRRWSAPEPTGRNGARRRPAGALAILPLHDVKDALLQWSPPLTGGSAGIRAGAAVAEFVPQWSPPLTGGNTGEADHHQRMVGRSAMEPAR